MVEARVEYDFDPQNDDELTLRAGDIITNIVQKDGGWWEGKLKEKHGLFPDNFVKVLTKDQTKNAEQSNAASNGVHLRKDKKRKCRVVYSYTPVNDDELELQVNTYIEVLEEVEEGWWKGVLDGRVGVFPSNFVEDAETTGSSRIESRSSKENVSDGLDKGRDSGGSGSNQIKPKPVRGVGLGNIFQDEMIKLKPAQDAPSEKRVVSTVPKKPPPPAASVDAPLLPPKPVLSSSSCCPSQSLNTLSESHEVSLEPKTFKVERDSSSDPQNDKDSLTLKLCQDWIKRVDSATDDQNADEEPAVADSSDSEMDLRLPLYLLDVPSPTNSSSRIKLPSWTSSQDSQSLSSLEYIHQASSEFLPCLDVPVATSSDTSDSYLWSKNLSGAGTMSSDLRESRTQVSELIRRSSGSYVSMANCERNSAITCPRTVTITNPLQQRKESHAGLLLKPLTIDKQSKSSPCFHRANSSAPDSVSSATFIASNVPLDPPAAESPYKFVQVDKCRGDFAFPAMHENRRTFVHMPAGMSDVGKEFTPTIPSVAETGWSSSDDLRVKEPEKRSTIRESFLLRSLLTPVKASQTIMSCTKTMSSKTMSSSPFRLSTGSVTLPVSQHFAPRAPRSKIPKPVQRCKTLIPVPAPRHRSLPETSPQVRLNANEPSLNSSLLIGSKPMGKSEAPIHIEVLHGLDVNSERNIKSAVKGTRSRKHRRKKVVRCLSFEDEAPNSENPCNETGPHKQTVLCDLNQLLHEKQMICTSDELQERWVTNGAMARQDRDGVLFCKDGSQQVQLRPAVSDLSPTLVHSFPVKGTSSWPERLQAQNSSDKCFKDLLDHYRTNAECFENEIVSNTKSNATVASVRRYCSQGDMAARSVTPRSCCEESVFEQFQQSLNRSASQSSCLDVVDHSFSCHPDRKCSPGRSVNFSSHSHNCWKRHPSHNTTHFVNAERTSTLHNITADVDGTSDLLASSLSFEDPNAFDGGENDRIMSESFKKDFLRSLDSSTCISSGAKRAQDLDSIENVHYKRAVHGRARRSWSDSCIVKCNWVPAPVSSCFKKHPTVGDTRMASGADSLRYRKRPANRVVYLTPSTSDVAGQLPTGYRNITNLGLNIYSPTNLGQKASTQSRQVTQSSHKAYRSRDDLETTCCGFKKRVRKTNSVSPARRALRMVDSDSLFSESSSSIEKSRHFFSTQSPHSRNHNPTPLFRHTVPSTPVAVPHSESSHQRLHSYPLQETYPIPEPRPNVQHYVGNCQQFVGPEHFVKMRSVDPCCSDVGISYPHRKKSVVLQSDGPQNGANALHSEIQRTLSQQQSVSNINPCHQEYKGTNSEMGKTDHALSKYNKHRTTSVDVMSADPVDPKRCVQSSGPVIKKITYSYPCVKSSPSMVAVTYSQTRTPAKRKRCSKLTKDAYCQTPPIRMRKSNKSGECSILGDTNQMESVNNLETHNGVDQKSKVLPPVMKITPTSNLMTTSSRSRRITESVPADKCLLRNTLTAEKVSGAGNMLCKQNYDGLNNRMSPKLNKAECGYVVASTPSNQVRTIKFSDEPAVSCAASCTQQSKTSNSCDASSSKAEKKFCNCKSCHKFSCKLKGPHGFPNYFLVSNEEFLKTEKMQFLGKAHKMKQNGLKRSAERWKDKHPSYSHKGKCNGKASGVQYHNRLSEFPGTSLLRSKGNVSQSRCGLLQHQEHGFQKGNETDSSSTSFSSDSKSSNQETLSSGESTDREVDTSMQSVKQKGRKTSYIVSTIRKKRFPARHRQGKVRHLPNSQPSLDDIITDLHSLPNVLSRLGNMVYPVYFSDSSEICVGHPLGHKLYDTSTCKQQLPCSHAKGRKSSLQLRKKPRCKPKNVSLSCSSIISAPLADRTVKRRASTGDKQFLRTCALKKSHQLQKGGRRNPRLLSRDSQHVGSCNDGPLQVLSPSTLKRPSLVKLEQSHNSKHRCSIKDKVKTTEQYDDPSLIQCQRPQALHFQRRSCVKRNYSANFGKTDNVASCQGTFGAVPLVKKFSSTISMPNLPADLVIKSDRNLPPPQCLPWIPYRGGSETSYEQEHGVPGRFLPFLQPHESAAVCNMNLQHKCNELEWMKNQNAFQPLTPVAGVTDLPGETMPPVSSELDEIAPTEIRAVYANDRLPSACLQENVGSMLSTSFHPTYHITTVSSPTHPEPGAIILPAHKAESDGCTKFASMCFEANGKTIKNENFVYETNQCDDQPTIVHSQGDETKPNMIPQIQELASMATPLLKENSPRTNATVPVLPNLDEVSPKLVAPCSSGMVRNSSDHQQLPQLYGDKNIHKSDSDEPRKITLRISKKTRRSLKDKSLLHCDTLPDLTLPNSSGPVNEAHAAGVESQHLQSSPSVAETINLNNLEVSTDLGISQRVGSHSSYLQSSVKCAPILRSPINGTFNSDNLLQVIKNILFGTTQQDTKLASTTRHKSYTALGNIQKPMSCLKELETENTKATQALHPCVSKGHERTCSNFNTPKEKRLDSPLCTTNAEGVERTVLSVEMDQTCSVNSLQATENKLTTDKVKDIQSKNALQTNSPSVCTASPTANNSLNLPVQMDLGCTTDGVNNSFGLFCELSNSNSVCAKSPPVINSLSSCEREAFRAGSDSLPKHSVATEKMHAFISQALISTSASVCEASNCTLPNILSTERVSACITKNFKSRSPCGNMASDSVPSCVSGALHAEPNCRHVPLNATPGSVPQLMNTGSDLITTCAVAKSTIPTCVPEAVHGQPSPIPLCAVTTKTSPDFVLEYNASSKSNPPPAIPEFSRQEQFSWSVCRDVCTEVSDTMLMKSSVCENLSVGSELSDTHSLTVKVVSGQDAPHFMLAKDTCNTVGIESPTLQTNSTVESPRKKNLKPKKSRIPVRLPETPRIAHSEPCTKIVKRMPKIFAAKPPPFPKNASISDHSIRGTNRRRCSPSVKVCKGNAELQSRWLVKAVMSNEDEARNSSMDDDNTHCASSNPYKKINKSREESSTQTSVTESKKRCEVILSKKQEASLLKTEDLSGPISLQLQRSEPKAMTLPATCLSADRFEVNPCHENGPNTPEVAYQACVEPQILPSVVPSNNRIEYLKSNTADYPLSELQSPKIPSLVEKTFNPSNVACFTDKWCQDEQKLIGVPAVRELNQKKNCATLHFPLSSINWQPPCLQHAVSMPQLNQQTSFSKSPDLSVLASNNGEVDGSNVQSPHTKLNVPHLSVSVKRECPAKPPRKISHTFEISQDTIPVSTKLGGRESSEVTSHPSEEFSAMPSVDHVSSKETEISSSTVPETKRKSWWHLPRIRLYSSGKRQKKSPHSAAYEQHTKTSNVASMLPIPVTDPLREVHWQLLSQPSVILDDVDANCPKQNIDKLSQYTCRAPGSNWTQSVKCTSPQPSIPMRKCSLTGCQEDNHGSSLASPPVRVNTQSSTSRVDCILPPVSLSSYETSPCSLSYSPTNSSTPRSVFSERTTGLSKNAAGSTQSSISWQTGSAQDDFCGAHYTSNTSADFTDWNMQTVQTLPNSVYCLDSYMSRLVQTDRVSPSIKELLDKYQVLPVKSCETVESNQPASSGEPPPTGRELKEKPGKSKDKSNLPAS